MDDLELQLYDVCETSCVRIRDIKDPNMRERFEKFMICQTRPLVEDLEMKDQDYVYVWDYRNFLNNERGKPVFWD